MKRMVVNAAARATEFEDYRQWFAEVETNLRIFLESELAYDIEFIQIFGKAKDDKISVMCRYFDGNSEFVEIPTSEIEELYGDHTPMEAAQELEEHYMMANEFAIAASTEITADAEPSTNPEADEAYIAIEDALVSWLAEDLGVSFNEFWDEVDAGDHDQYVYVKDHGVKMDGYRYAEVIIDSDAAKHIEDITKYNKEIHTIDPEADFAMDGNGRYVAMMVDKDPDHA